MNHEQGKDKPPEFVPAFTGESLTAGFPLGHPLVSIEKAYEEWAARSREDTTLKGGVKPEY